MIGYYIVPPTFFLLGVAMWLCLSPATDRGVPTPGTGQPFNLRMVLTQKGTPCPIPCL